MTHTLELDGMVEVSGTSLAEAISRLNVGLDALNLLPLRFSMHSGGDTVDWLRKSCLPTTLWSISELYGADKPATDADVLMILRFNYDQLARFPALPGIEAKVNNNWLPLATPLPAARLLVLPIRHDCEIELRCGIGRLYDGSPRFPVLVTEGERFTFSQRWACALM